MEPLEVLDIAIDPYEQNPSQAPETNSSRSTLPLFVPQVFQDRSKRSDADASSDQDGDLVRPNVLGGCPEWTVNRDRGERDCASEYVDRRNVRRVVDFSSFSAGRRLRPVDHFVEIDRGEPCVVRR